MTVGAVGTIDIRVDDDLCMGVRSCVMTARQSLRFDREIGKARPLDQPADELSAIVEAAASCPNFAITVVVDGVVVFDPEKQ